MSEQRGIDRRLKLAERLENLAAEVKDYAPRLRYLTYGKVEEPCEFGREQIRELIEALREAAELLGEDADVDVERFAWPPPGGYVHPFLADAPLERTA